MQSVYATSTNSPLSCLFENSYVFVHKKSITLRSYGCDSAFSNQRQNYKKMLKSQAFFPICFTLGRNFRAQKTDGPAISQCLNMLATILKSAKSGAEIPRSSRTLHTRLSFVPCGGIAVSASIGETPSYLLPFTFYLLPFTILRTSAVSPPARCRGRRWTRRCSGGRM